MISMIVSERKHDTSNKASRVRDIRIALWLKRHGLAESAARFALVA